MLSVRVETRPPGGVPTAASNYPTMWGWDIYRTLESLSTKDGRQLVEWTLASPDEQEVGCLLLQQSLARGERV